MSSTSYDEALGKSTRKEELNTENRGVDISIVIPVFNESDSLKLLCSKLQPVLDNMNKSYEIILVDDGSSDNSFGVLNSLHELDERIQAIRFRRNFGQSAAFSAGFDFARGDIIITMDADFQNDPADVPKLIETLEKGYDVVCGWRIDRKDHFLTRPLPSYVANFLISWITGIKLHDYGCSLKAHRADVVKNIRLYGEMHRFIPALASWMGISVCKVPVNHEPRRFGESKYGLMRTVRVILDLLTVKFMLGYSARPIQIFGLLGTFGLFFGIILGIYLSIAKIFFGHPLGDRPLLLLVILLITFGLQLITMGLLGELIVGNNYVSQNKTTYMIKEVLGENVGEEKRD